MKKRLALMLSMALVVNGGMTVLATNLSPETITVEVQQQIEELVADVVDEEELAVSFEGLGIEALDVYGNELSEDSIAYVTLEAGTTSVEEVQEQASEVLQTYVTSLQEEGETADLSNVEITVRTAEVTLVTLGVVTDEEIEDLFPITVNLTMEEARADSALVVVNHESSVRGWEDVCVGWGDGYITCKFYDLSPIVIVVVNETEEATDSSAADSSSVTSPKTGEIVLAVAAVAVVAGGVAMVAKKKYQEQ